MRLTNTCISKPHLDFVYPANGSGRKFQYRWFSEFPWLAYSKTDGAFCLHCVLFGNEESTHNASKLDRLYKSPLSNWANAPRRLCDHAEKSPLHHTATLKASHFRQCMEQKCKSIDVQVNEIVDEQVRK